ncbi:LolA-like protein [Terriglobus tenax]|uniref:DUF4292 domain-containing protein n=1 Tax=Terriglobus tenax TaxID=1111115 RepID=UPI0021E0A28A|nr:DUF4292 domain-containing protein [Terriglobus tenax]
MRAGFLLGAVLLTSGCFRHTYRVQKAAPVANVKTATLDELVGQIQGRFDSVKTMNASVEIVASTGGAKQGKVTVYTAFSGYILLRKPEDLRVLLLLPVVHTRAIDMVTDGTTFKMLIPPKNRAITGSNELATPSKNPLENLRPAVFYDSLMIKGVQPKELVALTSDERVYQPDPKKKDIVSEPDYDVSLYTQKNGGAELETRRVIHIGRSTMLPYAQDIYDNEGRVVTRATYENYQKFGDIDFPTKVTIDRPLDELKIEMTLTKVAPNQEMENDQFELTIPANAQVQKLP